MTFILNVLHKEFSLIAGDKRGSATGDMTLNLGGSTITVSSPKIVLNGVKKLYPDQSNTFVVGIAGNSCDHSYLVELRGCLGIDEALEAVHANLAKRFAGVNRAQHLQQRTVMENQGLATFFDPVAEEFFSNIFVFTDFYSHTRMFNQAGGGATLLHVGSGSSNLENAVGLESINEFLPRLRDGFDRDVCLSWMKHAFERVSQVDEGCGSEFVALMATRSDPTFTEIMIDQG